MEKGHEVGRVSVLLRLCSIIHLTCFCLLKGTHIHQDPMNALGRYQSRNEVGEEALGAEEKADRIFESFHGMLAREKEGGIVNEAVCGSMNLWYEWS